MAHDPIRQRVVLFGGATGDAVTCEWDGTTWTTRTPLTPPPQRCAPSYEPQARKLVCFSASSSTPYLYLP